MNRIESSRQSDSPSADELLFLLLQRFNTSLTKYVHGEFYRLLERISRVFSSVPIHSPSPLPKLKAQKRDVENKKENSGYLAENDLFERRLKMGLRCIWYRISIRMGNLFVLLLLLLDPR